MGRLDRAMKEHHANSDRYHAAAAEFHQSLVDHGSGSPEWAAAKEAYAKSGEEAGESRLTRLRSL